MPTYIMVKRNYKSPYHYPDEHAPYIKFKKVPMSTAFNMVNARVGWEKAKKGDYEHWRSLMYKQNRRSK